MGGRSVVGCCLAVVPFHTLRPEEGMIDEDFANCEPGILARLVSEFLGVFLPVVTVGLNVIMSSPAGRLLMQQRLGT